MTTTFNSTALFLKRLPQDSVIGSKLFLLYINNGDSLGDSAFCFADDVNETYKSAPNHCWEPPSLFHVYLRGRRQLHKTAQFPSVGHVQFIVGVLDLHNDFHATFLRMFPNWDALFNPPIQCFKERQSCKEIERDARENGFFSTPELAGKTKS